MNRTILTLLLLLTLLNRSAFATDALTTGPRDGKYRFYTYGPYPAVPIYLGYFVLSAGTYKAYLPGDKLSGEGRYSYHPDTHAISWDSGPYAGVWQGEFTVEREGKTHKIRLKRTVVATNSTDS